MGNPGHGGSNSGIVAVVGTDQRAIKAAQTTINTYGVAAAYLLGGYCSSSTFGLNGNQVVA